MITRILVWLAVIAACAAVLFGIVKGYEMWRGSVYEEGDVAGAARVQQLWNGDTIKRAAAAASATKAARTEEREEAAQAMEIEREARRNAEKLASLSQASAARSAAAAGGLSGHLAALDAAARGGGLPAAAACPGEFVKQRDAAILAREGLRSCVAEYQAMGRDDDDAIDAVTLRLDTALKYIAIVGPRP